MPAPTLNVLAFNCSLKGANGGEASSTDVLLKQLLDALAQHGAKGEIIRAVDHDIKAGVKSDEGEGDAWPALRERVIDADILVIGTPIWLGQPSSVAKRVLERMDAFLGETDAEGACRPRQGRTCSRRRQRGRRPPHGGRAVSGARRIGFTIPAGGVTYWVGEAMGEKEYKDFKQAPKAIAEWTPMLASNARISPACSRRKTTPGSRAAADGGVLRRIA